tara:strand:- start:216 stop:782 length:567 start_codon:yes stop_codon:yes gene_type:complete
MHDFLPKYYTFINTFKKEYIRKLDSNISIIYRNYSNRHDKILISEIRDFCKKINKKFFLANNIRLAKNLNLDGVYIPSFYKSLKTHNLNTNKRFLMIGSAHSVNEIKIKEKQGVKVIFISPLFKNKKNKVFLDSIKFNNLTLKTNLKIVALGGINAKNIIRLRQIRSYGFASISYIETCNNFNKYICK